MLNKIIRDYGYHKNLDAYHPDYVAAWEIAEYVPELIKRVSELEREVSERSDVVVERTAEAERLGRKRNAKWERAERLQVEIDAAHAALRSFLNVLHCECSDKGSRSYDCVYCYLEREIGIARNLLGE